MGGFSKRRTSVEQERCRQSNAQQLDIFASFIGDCKASHCWSNDSVATFSDIQRLNSLQMLGLVTTATRIHSCLDDAGPPGLLAVSRQPARRSKGLSNNQGKHLRTGQGFDWWANCNEGAGVATDTKAQGFCKLVSVSTRFMGHNGSPPLALPEEASQLLDYHHVVLTKPSNLAGFCPSVSCADHSTDDWAALLNMLHWIASRHTVMLVIKVRVRGSRSSQMAQRKAATDDIGLSPAPMELPPSSQRRQLRALSGSQPSAQTQPSGLLSNILRGESTQLDAEGSSHFTTESSQSFVIRETVQQSTRQDSNRSVSRPSRSMAAASFNPFGPGVDWETNSGDCIPFDCQEIPTTTSGGHPSAWGPTIKRCGRNGSVSDLVSRPCEQWFADLFKNLTDLAALRNRLEKEAEEHPGRFDLPPGLSQPQDDDDEATADPMRALMDDIRLQWGRPKNRDDESLQDVLDALEREADEEQAQEQAQKQLPIQEILHRHRCV
ncbi:unnamed protein product [Jaminaea pallidilutea]